MASVVRLSHPQTRRRRKLYSPYALMGGLLLFGLCLMWTVTTLVLSSSVHRGTLNRKDGVPSRHLNFEQKSGFDDIYERAQSMTGTCNALGSTETIDRRKLVPFQNDTVSSLPSFGILDALQKRNDGPQCYLPPDSECQETQISVIFMAHNPDRLKVTFGQIRTMMDAKENFYHLVAEVIIVWNGMRSVSESEFGNKILKLEEQYPKRLRVVYPLKMGLPNDLMNRYNPKVVLPRTKALLYYDDDGPFYSYEAIQSAFELWKRHPKAQIGAMARQITVGSRQTQEKFGVAGTETPKKAKPLDNYFVSHCTNAGDKVDYEFRFFANYDANMVLPSGSMLHANYLCHLFHPVFAEIRQFVLDHPVHPDDMTVSMIVSQLSGVAPRVYSRRLNKQSKRRLLFSICWDCGQGMTETKRMWADLRTEAVNALVQYFGSLNSGSIGWCPVGSEFYNAKKDGRCDPIMAKQGQLPWMNANGTPKESCP